jgi:hypothetical protein
LSNPALPLSLLFLFLQPFSLFLPLPPAPPSRQRPAVKTLSSAQHHLAQIYRKMEEI